MKINVNGITRDMTPEEISAFESLQAQKPAQELTPEERITELEEALALLLSGVTE